MASLYDKILVKGSERFRLNKNFVKADSVEEHVKEVLTFDNIVDENGMIVVDQKNDEAKVPSEENQEELADKVLAADDTDTTIIDESEKDENDDDSSDDESEDDTPTKKDSAAPKVYSEDDLERAREEARAEAKAEASTKATRTSRPEVDKFKSKVPQSVPGMGFPRKNGKTVDIFDGVTPHTHVKLVGGHHVPLSAANFNSKTENQILKRLSELGYQVVDFNELERKQAFAGATGGDGLIMEDEDVEEDIKLG